MTARRKQMQQQKGFTLVEVVLALAIFSLLALSVSEFFIVVIHGRAVAQVHLEVQDQGRLATAHIAYEIRRANGIDPASTFGVNLATTPGAALSLTMSDASRNPTVFSVSNGILYLKQGSGAAAALTSKDVAVSSLIFSNLSPVNGRSKDILVNLTLTRPDPTGTVSATLNYPLETSVELQGK